MKNTKLSLVLAGMLALTTTTYADDKSDIAELKQQVKTLTENQAALVDETSNLQTGFSYTKADATKTHSGLGPAASKVYFSKSPLSIGGYGEMYISTTDGDNQDRTSETQVKRFITYFGYKFSDNIILNTEIEYEGGGVKQNTSTIDGDEVIVEFMYLDFLGNKNINARLGNFLMPMGLINQQHEPTLFTTVQRPKTSYYIIPSTWNQSGVMAYGDIIDGLEYKAGLVTAMQKVTTKATSSDNDKWFRNGRSRGFKIKNVEFAAIARLDYTGTNGLLVGASVYGDEDTLLWDVHADYKVGAARIYGTYASNNRSNTTATNAVTESFGGYLNASYDMLSFTDSAYKLPLFVQYETFNAQAARADGTSNDDTQNTSVGINFFPLEQVVLKADYVISTTDSVTSNTTSFSMGFLF